MGFGPGLGFFGHIIHLIAAGLAAFVVFLIVAAILVVVLRFLLIATKAARLYIANNSPVVPAEDAVSETPTAPAKPSGRAPKPTP